MGTSSIATSADLTVAARRSAAGCHEPQPTGSALGTPRCTIEHGPDDMTSCIEECFYSSLEGSYFKRELTKARDDKRIGQPVPYDPSRLVNTVLGHRHGR